MICVSTWPAKKADEPLIVCEHLALGYGKDVLLTGINLTINRGVFFPFVGPNGSGKTTLVRAILGLIPPLRGKIRTPFAVCPPGYVSQQKTIDPLYPVCLLDIVLMGAYQKMGWHGRHNRRASKDRAIYLLREFGLAKHMHKTFDQLSGGIRQKALIARALAGSPEVLVMDEPTSELDYHAQRSVLEMLQHAVQNEGLTVLLVHHGLNIISEMASEVCLVNEGTAQTLPLKEAIF